MSGGGRCVEATGPADRRTYTKGTAVSVRPNHAENNRCANLGDFLDLK